MHCPFCSAIDTKVIDSRLAAEGSQVRRRRQCTECGERFTTFEVMEMVMPRIIKSNGLREPYDYNKLRRSMALPLQKRPVSIDEIDTMVHRIEQRLRQTGEREVSSRTLGEIVMGELRAIDDVAYVRFASVYRDFQDIEAFKAELENFTPKISIDKETDDCKSTANDDSHDNDSDNNNGKSEQVT